MLIRVSRFNFIPAFHCDPSLLPDAFRSSHLGRINYSYSPFEKSKEKSRVVFDHDHAGRRLRNESHKLHAISVAAALHPSCNPWHSFALSSFAWLPAPAYSNSFFFVFLSFFFLFYSSFFFSSCFFRPASIHRKYMGDPIVSLRAKQPLFILKTSSLQVLDLPTDPPRSTNRNLEKRRREIERERKIFRRVKIKMEIV